MGPQKWRVWPWLVMAAAVLCALAAYGFWRQGLQAEEAGSARAIAYMAGLQTRIVEHRGLLYRQLVRPGSEQAGYLDGLERELMEGAGWLERAGEPETALAVRDYLGAAAGVRGAQGPAAGEVLAGPAHRAAEAALTQVGQALERAAGTDSPASAATQRARGTAEIFLVLSLTLGAIALGAALWRGQVLAAATDPAAAPEAAHAPAPLRGGTALSGLAQQGRELAVETRGSLRTTDQLAQGLAEVRDASKSHAARLHQITMATARLREALAETAAELHSRAGAGREAMGRANLLADQAGEAAGQVGEAAEWALRVQRSAEHMAAAADRALGDLRQLTAQGDRTVLLLGGMHERAAHIDQVLAAMKSIATKTQMLALNAAIEAARAGERGKGFAVVADSVRQLATTAQQHVKEIGARVAGFAEASQSTLEEARRQRELVDGAARQVEGAWSGLDELTRDAGEAAGLARRGADGVHSLERAWRDAAASFDEAAATAGEGSAFERAAQVVTGDAAALALNAGETATALAEAASMAADLRVAVARLAQRTEGLSEEAESIVVHLDED